MGIGLVIAVLGVGSTLASTITINSGQKTEFGQGVERTVYCGGERQITIKPTSGYYNHPEPTPSSTSDEGGEMNSNSISSPGDFFLSGISVSDIPEECSGVDFVLSAYPSDGTLTPVTLAIKGGESLTATTVYWDNTSGGTAIVSASRDRWQDPNGMATVTPGLDGSFAVNFPIMWASMNINDIGRILIETQDDVIFQDYSSLGLQPVRAARIRR
jgi:hypothetical protein